MAPPTRRTTMLLVGLAVVFVVVLIILVVTPAHQHDRKPVHQEYEQGKSARTTPKGVIIETEATTTTPTTTRKTSTSTTTTTTTTAATTTTTATTTRPPTTTTDFVTDFPDVFADDETSTYASTSDATTSTTQPTTTTTKATTRETFLEDPATNVTTTEATYNETSTVYNVTQTYDTTPYDVVDDDNVTTEAPPHGTTVSRNETEEELDDGTTTTTSYVVTATSYVTTAASYVTTAASYDNDTTTGLATDAATSADEGMVANTTEETVTNTTTLTTDNETTTTSVTTDAAVTTDATSTATTTTTTASVTTDAVTADTTPTETPTTTSAHTVATPPPGVEKTVCDHPDCKELAARMLDMMDHRASPCKDFYQYACGGAEDDPFLQPEDPGKDVQERIERMLASSDEGGVSEPAKELYRSCLKKPYTPTAADIALLRNTVNKHGQLDPRAVSGANVGSEFDYIDQSPFSLQAMLVEFFKFDYSPFLDVTLDIDRSDSSSFSVRLSLPVRGFESGFSPAPDTWYCRKEYEDKLESVVKNREKGLDATVEYEKLNECRTSGHGHGRLVTRLKEAARALNLTGHVKDTLLGDKLVEETAFSAEFFLRDIKEAWPSLAEVRHQLLSKNYTVCTVADLDSKDILTNNVNWSGLLQSVVGDRVDKVQLYHEEELRSILRRIGEMPQAELRNILLLMWSDRVYTDLVSPVGSPGLNTPDYCARVTQYLAPDMAGELFLKSFPPEDLQRAKRQVERLVNSVKHTIAAALPHQHTALRSKLQYTFTQVGAASDLQNLQDEISNRTVELRLTGSYAANALKLLRRRRRQMYSLVKDNTNGPRAMWHHFSVPYSTTATTLYAANTILIPEGVMAPPLLYPRLPALPDYILYAGIGHLIAHEFLHAMDSTGILYDGLVGSPLPDYPKMKEQTYCLQQILQTNFSVLVRKSTTMSFMLPPDLHLNEMLADTGASRLAWLAYIHGDNIIPGSPPDIATESTSRRRRQAVTASPTPTTASLELPLPYLGLTPYQLYLLRTAQTQCTASSVVDAMAVMEREHLPARVRVNLALINEPLFAEAFHCPAGSRMRLDYTCPILVGHMPATPSNTPH